MINICIGDMLLDSDKYIIVDTYDLKGICSRNLSDKIITVNAISLGLQKDKIIKIIENAQSNILILVKDDKVITAADLKKIKRKVNVFYGTEYTKEFNLFKALEIILFEKDRDFVRNYLIETKAPIKLLIMWLYSSFQSISGENLDILSDVDCYMFRADEEHIYNLLSALKPQTKNYRNIFQVFKYKYKKQTDK